MNIPRKKLAVAEETTNDLLAPIRDELRKQR